MESKNIVLLGFVSSAARYLDEQFKDNNKAAYLDELNKIDFSNISQQLSKDVDFNNASADYLMKAGEYAFENFISEKKQEAMLNDFGAIFGEEKETGLDSNIEAQINRIVAKTAEALKANIETVEEDVKEEAIEEETIEEEVVEEETSELEKKLLAMLEEENVEETVAEDEEEIVEETATEDETIVEETAVDEDVIEEELASDNVAVESIIANYTQQIADNLEVGAGDELDRIFNEIINSEDNPVLAIIKDMEKGADAFRYIEPNEVKEVEEDQLLFVDEDIEKVENDFLSNIITNPGLDMVEDLFDDEEKEEPKPEIKVEEKKSIVVDGATFNEDDVVPKPLVVKEEPKPEVKVEEKKSIVVEDATFNEDDVVPKPLVVKEEPKVEEKEELFEPQIDVLYEPLEEEPVMHIIENPAIDFEVEEDIDVDEFFEEEENEALLEEAFVRDLEQLVNTEELPKVDMPLVREFNDINLDIAGFIIDEEDDDSDVQEKLKWSARPVNNIVEEPIDIDNIDRTIEPLPIHVENYVNEEFDTPVPVVDIPEELEKVLEEVAVEEAAEEIEEEAVEEAAEEVQEDVVEEAEEPAGAEETAVVEEEAVEEELDDDDYINSLISNLREKISKEESERNNAVESKNDTYLRINKTYPYLSQAFVRSVYDLKDIVSKQYAVNEEIILLHRLTFNSVDSLRQFVEIVMNHDYFVNVDEDKMIVDTFKRFVNTDGKILTNIFEIANQAKLLGGDYEGYRVIKEDKE